MENAIWNGEKVLASEIGKDYFYEKQVRKASYHGELYCPDCGCKSPILKYCHGEIREPYFAHRDNTECDYIRFEKSKGLFHALRLRLYEHFLACDYPVSMEVKVLKHHYCDLLFEWENGSRTVIELGTKTTSVKEVEEMNEEYEKEGIDVIWLVVDQSGKSIQEQHTYFLKRYCLNESRNKSLFVLDYNGEYITQYKEDKTIYEINGQQVEFEEYSKLFAYETYLTDLFFDEEFLTTFGFQESYENFLEEKQYSYEKLKRENEEAKEYLQRQYDALKKDKTIKPAESYVVNAKGREYEERRNAVMLYMSQQDKPVRDEQGIRWIRCEICGEVKEEAEFASYGGLGHVNLGECKRCKFR